MQRNSKFVLRGKISEDMQSKNKDVWQCNGVVKMYCEADKGKMHTNDNFEYHGR